MSCACSLKFVQHACCLRSSRTSPYRWSIICSSASQESPDLNVLLWGYRICSVKEGATAVGAEGCGLKANCSLSLLLVFDKLFQV